MTNFDHVIIFSTRGMWCSGHLLYVACRMRQNRLTLEGYYIRTCVLNNFYFVFSRYQRPWILYNLILFNKFRLWLYVVATFCLRQIIVSFISPDVRSSYSFSLALESHQELIFATGNWAMRSLAAPNGTSFSVIFMLAFTVGLIGGGAGVPRCSGQSIGQALTDRAMGAPSLVQTEFGIGESIGRSC